MQKVRRRNTWFNLIWVFAALFDEWLDFSRVVHKIVYQSGYRELLHSICCFIPPASNPCAQSAWVNSVHQYH